MSESSRDRVRLLDNILTLSGISIGLSSLIRFSADALDFPFDVARQLSLLTIVYHSVVLILSRFRYTPTNTPNYYDRDSHLIMRPAIGIAAFLLVVWLVVISLMIASLIFHFSSNPGGWWRGLQLLERIWAQFFLGVVETGVLMYLITLCIRARKSVQLDTEPEGRNQAL
jgi:hypothetical protein